MSRRIRKTLAGADTPSGYAAVLAGIKTRVRSAQLKAAAAVSCELVQLYWDIGRTIALNQAREGWGSKAVDRLADDLQREFTGVAGFSRTNVYRMRAFYQAYAPEPVVPQPVGRKASSAIVPQAVGQLEPDPWIARQPYSRIPWGHNVVLLERLADNRSREWYAQQTIANGWSRSMLEHWIEADLYARQGKAVTNFQATLPPAKSDLALQVLKDPYNFDFLTLRQDAAERELEEGLTGQITRFLLELGEGFAFVGRQVPLTVDGEDFYIDLLFYHLQLRAFVVIDLKARKFVPEYAGKMNFYLSAVDDLMRKPGDGPSIGLILCKDRSRIIAEYALRCLERPVGVAKYVMKLTERLPKELEGKLPAVKEIEAELGDGAQTKPGRTARGGKKTKGGKRVGRRSGRG